MSRCGWGSRTVLLIMACCVVTFGSATGARAGEGSDQDRLVEAARDIIAAAPLCALVTIGADGSPHVRMMDAFPPDGDMVVWMATNQLSRKVEDLRGNPRVAVYYADPEAPGYVTIRGTARLVDDPAETRRRWKEEWSAFYGEDRSNYLLIEIRPATVEVVNMRAGVVSGATNWAAPAIDLDALQTAAGD